MKTDIYQKIERDFGNDIKLALEQIEILDARSKGLIGDRMLRAMIFLAKGNLERFKQVIELGRTDYRNILWQAEYDCGEEQIYDFNKTFHELKLMGK
ncbi:hypothetical protein [Saccharophagus degradans]|uniref:Uncharacterized protein n=1 Tax=Saccharophagus degradans (strain 2-40 / ATCC 43961 / DSM 17024) TaxID=203122 RepID=Q21JQ3_SACD2|nr:hypothetical protein [Saccharophagus degradans]ABD81076.1 hypothetical protein Sde_1816 [Saccharophagus degradans 2-40]WGO98128.1 hypothetical protein QFX18_19155 [Saccharophagus degradans]